MKKVYSLLLFLIILSFSGQSQITYESRVEFELKNGYYNEKILEFGEKGLIIASKAEELKGKEREWKYEKYDINLKSVRSKSIFLNKKLYSDESYESQLRTHRFFRDKKGNFTIVTVGSENLETNKVKGVLPKKTVVSDMAVVGDFVFLRARIKKEPFK